MGMTDKQLAVIVELYRFGIEQAMKQDTKPETDKTLKELMDRVDTALKS